MNVDKIPHRFLIKLYKNLLSKKQTIEDRIRTLSAVENDGFLTCCYNADIEDETEKKQKILRFLNGPSRESWNEIYQMSVTTDKTMWQVWNGYDPSSPKEIPACDELVRRWPVYPDPAEIVLNILEELIDERDGILKEHNSIKLSIQFLQSKYPVLERKFQPDINLEGSELTR